MVGQFGVLPSLSVVTSGFTAELDQIESIFSRCKGMSQVSEYTISYSPSEDGCLVSLWDSWNRFVRRLFLTCASGGVEGLSGQSYFPATTRTEASALTHIASHRRGTKIRIVGGEPYWFDVAASADLGQVLGLSNSNTVVSALTASQIQLGPFLISNPLEDIRLCRNFVAHKNPGTLSEMIRVAGPGFQDLPNYLRSRRSGVELFSDWKEACRVIAMAACQ